MPKWLAIAAYRCEVAGSPSESLDIRVRAFNLETRAQVEEALADELPESFQNAEGEEVSWPLAQILAIEEYEEQPSGDEVIGFIATPAEISTWTHREEP